MRIRKHAAKLLLGSARPLQQYSPPPPPPADDEYERQSVSDHGSLFLCQLNCSPWDVLELDSNYFYFHHQQEAEDGDEGKGSMGNLLGFGNEEGIFGISEALTKSSIVVAEPYFDCRDEHDSDEKKKVKKKRRRRKKNEEKNDDDVDDNDKEKTSSVVTVIAKSGGGAVAGTATAQGPGICKKNDGKGWHCNRPANPHHTLCDHHLTQLKSYSSARYNNNGSNNNNSNIAAAGVVESEPNAAREVKNHNKPGHAPPPVKHRKRKTKAAAVTAAAASDKSDGDGYYYYSGFGLSRGKSRSSGRKEVVKVRPELVEEVVSAEKEGYNVFRSGDGSDAPIAGGDLDDDTDDDDDKNPVGNVDNNKGRIQRKKRGRKPIKARSLKSLL